MKMILILSLLLNVYLGLNLLGIFKVASLSYEDEALSRIAKSQIGERFENVGLLIKADSLGEVNRKNGWRE